MKQPGSEWQAATEQIHAGDAHNPSAAVSSPIYQSATFRFADPDDIAAAMVAHAHPQFYGRYATPNTQQVETTIARLEGGEAGLVTASGMAAIALALLTFLQQGDHLVAQRTLYPAAHTLMSRKLATLGIEASFVDQADIEAFAAAIRPNTRLIYVESPANPTLILTDLAAIAGLAQAHNLISVIDNTFATPYNQRPLEHGLDLVVHSATKYLGGHSDVVAGAIVGRQEQVVQMWENSKLFGAVLHPFEAWLLERGLKTFDMRMERHNGNALAVARFLEEHPAVGQVYYPGLPSHPQHELARRQMSGGYSGMVCFDLAGGLQAGYRLLRRVRLISLAVSLGGVHSLVTHPASTVSTMYKSEEELIASGVQPGLVRLSVGLEAAADILADLDQALADE